MTGQIISLLDLQDTRETPIATLGKKMANLDKSDQERSNLQ